MQKRTTCTHRERTDASGYQQPAPCLPADSVTQSNQAKESMMVSPKLIAWSVSRCPSQTPDVAHRERGQWAETWEPDRFIAGLCCQVRGSWAWLTKCVEASQSVERQIMSPSTNINRCCRAKSLNTRRVSCEHPLLILILTQYEPECRATGSPSPVKSKYELMPKRRSRCNGRQHVILVVEQGAFQSQNDGAKTHRKLHEAKQ